MTIRPPQNCEVVAMIIRGTPIHRDGHGKCGLLTSVVSHCLSPFIASRYGLSQRVVVRTSTKRSTFVSQAWPWILQPSQRHDQSGEQMPWRLANHL